MSRLLKRVPWPQRIALAVLVALIVVAVHFGVSRLTSPPTAVPIQLSALEMPDARAGATRIDALDASEPLASSVEAEHDAARAPVGATQDRSPATGRLSGRLVDLAGEPIARHEMWLHGVSASTPTNSLSMGMAFGPSTDPTTPHRFHVIERGPGFNTFTDEDGHFEFARVTQGHWLLGPAPTQIDARALEMPLAAPVSERIVIDDATRETTVELSRARGLYITGWIERPSGERVAGRVHAEGPSGLVDVDASVEHGFTLGPLMPGAHEIYAEIDRDHAVSPVTVAYSGTRDLALRLETGASLTVTFIGPHASEGLFVALEREGGSVKSTRWSNDRASTLSFPELAPGVYTLRAQNLPRFSASRRGIAVELGENTIEVEVFEDPAARVMSSTPR